MLDASFEEVERAHHVHFERQARLVLALPEPRCSLVEYVVATLHRCLQCLAITQVRLNELDLAPCPRLFEVLGLASHQAVVDEDMRALGDEQIDDVRADQAGPAGHQNTALR
jgi:hypothetical protein